MGLIVGVDTAGGEDGDVNALQITAVGQVEGTNDIVSDGLLLVVLAPINIWSAGRSSRVEDVGGLDSLQLGNDSLTILHANGRGVNLLACQM